MSVSEIVCGVFKEELKNRFLCTVSVNGTDTLCYIPSSCRLSNFIDLTNRAVLLQPTKKSDARTNYSVYAVKYKRSYVPLNLSGTNQVIESNISRRFFAFLGSRKNVTRESQIDTYKSDLYIEDTDTVIEVKSILSFNKTAQFPTVVSERANRQLDEINGLLMGGHKVCYLFISMYSGVQQIFINEKQAEYYRRFRECMNNGMQVCAFSLEMKENKPTVKARLPVKF